MRIGLIHVSHRKDTWGRYLLWGLRRWFPQHEAVWCAQRVDIDEFMWAKPDCDVYVRIEDSGAYRVPETYRPLVYWCGDSHISDGVPRKQLAREADFTFVAQKNAVGDIGDEWLPHTCWYTPEPEKSPKWLVSSAVTLSDKNPIFAERAEIAGRIKVLFGKHVNIKTGIYFKDMARLYADSHVVWNHPVNFDLGMRVFEAFGCGACLVTGHIKDNGLEDIFGDIPLQYDTSPDCMKLIEHCWAKPDDCRERGMAGRKIIQEGHTYHHRLERLVAKCEELVK